MHVLHVKHVYMIPVLNGSHLQGKVSRLSLYPSNFASSKLWSTFKSTTFVASAMINDGDHVASACLMKEDQYNDTQSRYSAKTRESREGKKRESTQKEVNTGTRDSKTTRVGT